MALNEYQVEIEFEGYIAVFDLSDKAIEADSKQ